ncbi:MAG: ADP-ribosylglycohydrolase family protein, partial [bacterium]|nr:ADP-ribosylglycohydrolase family protein [bacterium]
NNTKISKPDILNKSILKTYDNIIIDKIIGTIYGNAIGDAIGLGTEFMTKKQIEYYYPNGFNSYNQIISDKHRSNWQPGEWTDDTDQMLCILDTILKYKTVDIKDIAKNIHNWAHSGGKGIGQHTYKVITNSMFKSDPHKVSKKVWLDSDKRSAANGAVMRTSILGIWDHDDIGKVMYNTKQAAKVTHCDPRCIGSCIAVTTTISNILQGENDFNKLLEPAKKIAAKYDDRINEYLEYSKAEDIAALELDEDKSIGYTLKAIAAGFWALKHIDFKEAILKIVNQGGDADTNAAVAGAMLGAKLGYSNLPKDWIDGLLNKHKLNGKINQLIDIMKEEGQIG